MKVCGFSLLCLLMSGCFTIKSATETSIWSEVNCKVKADVDYGRVKSLIDTTRKDIDSVDSSSFLVFGSVREICEIKF